MNNYVELKEKLNGINHNINNTNANKTNEVRQLNNNNKQVNQPKTRNVIDIFLNNSINHIIIQKYQKKNLIKN